MASITRYISPTGMGNGQTLGAPCSLSQAITDGNNNAPTGSETGQGHKIYALPGIYGGISLNSAGRWSGSTWTAIDASGGRLTRDASLEESGAMFNGATAPGVVLYVNYTNIIFNEIVYKGNYAVRDASGATGITAIFNNCKFKQSNCLVWAVAGALTFNNCKFEDALSSSAFLIQGGTATMNNSVCSPSPNVTGLNVGSTHGVQASSGTFNFNNSLIQGCKNNSINISSTATVNITNSIIGASWTASANTIQKSGGTLNITNSLIGRNGYNYDYISNTTYNVDSNNIKNNSPGFVRATRGGILSLHFDDCANSQRVIDATSVLKSYGVKATYYLDLKYYFENISGQDVANIAILNSTHSDTVELAPHTWAHTNMSYTHGLHFDNPSGGSISFGDPLDPPILSNGDVYTGDYNITSTGPEPFTFNATGKTFDQIIAGINALPNGWVCSKSTTGGQLATNVSGNCCGADLTPLASTAIVPGVGIDIDFDVTTTDGTKGLFRQEVWWAKDYFASIFPNSAAKNIGVTAFGAHPTNSKIAAKKAGYDSWQTTNAAPQTNASMLSQDMMAIPRLDAEIITGGILITGAATDSGEIKLTVTAHRFANGDSIVVQGISGTADVDHSANGTWTVKNKDTNTITLTGSSFDATAGAYVFASLTSFASWSDAEITARAKSLYQIADERGDWLIILVHQVYKATAAQIDLLLNIANKFPGLRKLSTSAAVAEIYATHTRLSDCDDGGLTPTATYTHTFSDSTDYHLQPSSPCIGAGTAISGITTDIEGNPRFPPYNIGPFGLAEGALDVAPVANDGAPRNNITRLTGTSNTINPTDTYQFADTNAWRVVTEWVAGTANFAFDANGIPISFTGQQLIDAGVGPRLYCGSKRVAGYTVDQDAAANAKIIRILKVPTYIDTLYWSDSAEMDWSASNE